MKYIFYLFFLLLAPSAPLLAQEKPAIPSTRDSLERYILTKRSTGKTDWNYYEALKLLSKQLMYDNRKTAVNYLNEAMIIAITYKDTIEMAAIDHLLGLTYRHWGYTYAAAEYFQRSYLLSEKIGRKDIAGYDLLSIGNVYFDLKKWPEANIYYHRALKSFNIHDEIGGIAVAFNNIALVFQETEKLDSAQHYFYKGLDYRRLQKDSILVAHSFWYLATVCLDMNKTTDGLFFAKKSQSYFDEYWKNDPLSDLKHIPLALKYHIGCLYEKEENIDSAVYYWNKAIELGQDNPKLTSYFLASYGALAKIKIRQGKTKEAIKLLKEGIDHATTLHFSEEQEKLLLQIADLLERESRYSEAAGYLREYQALLKSKALGASNQMLNFHVLFETYEQKSALREQEMLLERERLMWKQQRQLNLMYLFGLAIALIGLLFVLKLYRSIRYINKSLAQKNDAIEAQKDIIEQNAHELQQLNETKDLLFSIIAHDLRSPFNTLTNFSKLMQTYIQNNQWHELKNSFRVLEESSQKAYWTFENLLGWVQSQTGKLEANIQSVDLMPLLDEALGLSSSMLLLKNLTINKKIAARYIMADSYMLETMLRNLLTNAIKFSNDLGEITIESHLENEHIKIIISDKGTGMSEAATKKLFNPEKLKATSQSISGLGLMICKQFIDCMNGQISVKSALGQGTQFTIILPKGEIPSIYTMEKKQQDSLYSIEKSIQDNILPEQLKAVLQPYLPELFLLSVYEASEVKEVMQKIYQIPNLEKEIEIWLSKLNQALYLSDSCAFDKLLDNLK